MSIVHMELNDAGNEVSVYRYVKPRYVAVRFYNEGIDFMEYNCRLTMTINQAEKLLAGLKRELESK